MTSESVVPDLELTVDPAITETEVNEKIIENLQVRFKNEEGKLLLILPTETELPSSATSWSDIWQQMKQRLNGGDRFWQQNTIVHLMAADRLLDGRQLQAIADALLEVELQLERVHTSRRQTAVAAATAGYCVEQAQPLALNQTKSDSPPPLLEPLYLQMTVRSGVEIRHAGTVIILGDLNPGGIVVANGDILVWGRLRGVAHAGASGNFKCMIMALQMEPTQLRIADYVARAPKQALPQFYAEVAYVSDQGIRITKAADFSKSQLTSQS